MRRGDKERGTLPRPFYISPETLTRGKIQVPAPNDKQVNDTTNCVAECPQGDGSEAQTQKYSECTQGCIKKYYFDSSQGATPSNGGSGNSGSGASSGAAGQTKTGVVASVTSAAGSAIASASSALESAAASASAAVTSTTPNAAPAVAVGSAAILGLVAAVIAL